MLWRFWVRFRVTGTELRQRSWILWGTRGGLLRELVCACIGTCRTNRTPCVPQLSIPPGPECGIPHEQAGVTVRTAAIAKLER